MRQILIFFSVLIVTLFVVGCGILEVNNEDDTNRARDDIDSVAELDHTDIFHQGALEHIFIGALNKRGDAVGFHYEDFPGTKGDVIEGTRTQANDQGVYEAEVTVEDIKKSSNHGKSTFFPKEMDAQAVVDAIHQAYDEATFIQGNTYEGLSESGMVIHMYLDQDEKIISAFPIY